LHFLCAYVYWVDYSGCWIQIDDVYGYDYDYDYDRFRSTLDECKAVCADNYNCVAIAWGREIIPEMVEVDDMKFCMLMSTAPSVQTTTTDYKDYYNEVITIDYYELRRICPQG